MHKFESPNLSLRDIYANQTMFTFTRLQQIQIIVDKNKNLVSEFCVAMAGVWNAIVTAVLRTRDKDEKLRKENARIDREIASKKLEIKKIKTNVRNYRKDKFHDKLEKLPAKVTVVNIDGLSRTSDK